MIPGILRSLEARAKAWGTPFVALLNSDAPMDVDARRLVSETLARADRRDARLNLKLSIALHIVIATGSQLFARADIRPFMVGIHLCFGFINAGMTCATRLRDPRPVFFLTQLVFAWAYAELARRSYTLSWGYDFDMLPSLVSAMLCATTVGCAYRDWPVVVFASMSAIAPFVLCFGDPHATGWILVHCVAIGGATAFRLACDAASRAAVTSDIRSRLQIAPRQVVRRSLDGDGTLDSVFRPELRPCAFLSAELAGTGDDSMRSFHEVGDALLRRLAPDGAYYTDWMGGDLFIVFYAESIAAAVQTAAAVGAALVGAAPGFVAADVAFDVGLAAGTALVGIMGPPGARKVTAIGEAAGRARRCLAAGRHLRTRFGPANRLIADAETGTYLTGAAIRHYRLAPTECIKDLGDEIAYLDPGAVYVRAA